MYISGENMKSFKVFVKEEMLLAEASKGGFSDEHALEKAWNHVSGKNKNAIEEVKKAETDKKHPLHFDNQDDKGFTGGKKEEHHRAAYYAEMHHAAKAVESMRKHPTFKKAHAEGHKAEVKGAARGKLSDTWTNHGAKNATSKEDIRIGKHRVSLKKGDSQLMSAESAETRAIYHHATHKAIEHGHMTHAEAEEVRKKIDKVAKHMEAMKHEKDRKKKEKHRDDAQKHINEIHSRHENLIHHVAHEAATGHGKFGGHDSEGSARHLVTTTPSGETHIHDTKTNNEPITYGVPRVALPKGSGRPGNLKLDYRVKHTLAGKPK